MIKQIVVKKMKLNYLCPVCGERLKASGGVYKCRSGHSFDISKKGYVNLLTTKGRNPGKAGDNKEMIRARSAFLDLGLYAPLANLVAKKICELTAGIKEPAVIDSGCGEGYYTAAFADHNKNAAFYGVDISKHGVDHAASRARAAGLENIHLSVASAFSLPFKNDVADVVVSIFAPVSNDEYARVLKQGGKLIVVSPTAKHLFGLKSALYAQPYDNEPNRYGLNKFSLSSTEELEYDITVTGESIWQLFTMTPYYYKTSKEAAERLKSTTQLETAVGFSVSIYTKSR